MTPTVRRDPDLVLLWRANEMLIRNVRTGRSVRVSPGAVALLDAFSRPMTAAAMARASPAVRAGPMGRAIRELRRFGLVVPCVGGRRADRLAGWNGNVASALYHAATRDLKYIEAPAETRAFMRERQAKAGPPPDFKRYRGRPVIVLPGPAAADGAGASLPAVLEARRTTRDFLARAVPLAAFAAILARTWGQTGWLDGGELGRLPTRTSPSGGALHPIECYVVVRRVDGVEPGLYHYDARGNELRRLRRGDFKSEIVLLASNQRWVGRAAFLCIMTAAFQRTMWKYRRENAYRTVWLEAGHFAQTFSLLATFHGLGPFTTAAMQDTRIERFIGLDGIREFPVYLCGAGIPGARRNSPRWMPLGKRKAPPVIAAAVGQRSPSKPRRAASGKRRAPTPP